MFVYLIWPTENWTQNENTWSLGHWKGDEGASRLSQHFSIWPWLLHGKFWSALNLFDLTVFPPSGEVSDVEMQEHYDEFFEEVFTELEEKYGEIEEMNVCDNLGDHLVGNVYIKVFTIIGVTYFR